MVIIERLVLNYQLFDKKIKIHIKNKKDIIVLNKIFQHFNLNLQSKKYKLAGTLEAYSTDIIYKYITFHIY
jgi:hypothetical protein